MRVLVIDDSRTHRIIIGQILREIGMEVLEAANGLEALERLKTHPNVELLLVDWNMPVMNGLELVRAVRAESAYDAVRILMVTSEAQGEQVGQALGAGANEYLMKPFNKDGLVSKLELLNAMPE
jgi:two-component system, chemotaxis family, chemotaxis protein CheY